MIYLNPYSSGPQHIGIPADGIERTIAFYTSPCFFSMLRTENETIWGIVF